MGLHQDPSTGLGMLVKKGMVSFVQPVELTDYLSSGCELGSTCVCCDHVMMCHINITMVLGLNMRSNPNSFGRLVLHAWS